MLPIISAAGGPTRHGAGQRRRAAATARPGPATGGAYVFYRNLCPAPAWPLNVLPCVFVGALVAGVVGFAVLRVRRPEVAERAGSFADGLD
ncbi:hypothetical protein [Streptomyces sp. NPDC048496]|uniref:hypothetical protein n=1 Tax=Streptomyces sp. NPDC048496 TaxID=3365558 RepID=UPI0037115147